MVASARFPTQTSMKSLYHFGQIIHARRFQDFDYSDSQYNGNKIHYGTSLIPFLDLKRINKMPIALFTGRQDPLAKLDDVQWLKTQLGNVKHFQIIENHDHGFTLCKNMDYMNDVMKVVQQYNPVSNSLMNLGLY